MTTRTPVRYIPAGYELLRSDASHGVEVWGQMQPRIVAMCFGGKRSKPDWHFRFQSIERLHAKIDEHLNGLDAWKKRKDEWKAKRNAPHDVKVGDIFRASWGYDQTNIDYYECTRVISDSTIEIRPIGKESEEIEYHMQGRCVPALGVFTGEPMRKRVSMAGGEPSVSITSYANAYRMKPREVIPGCKVYESSHWTAYA